MARTSDTRARVRIIAEQLLACGEQITSRKVLKVLGVGSLSTITDELGRWEQERGAESRRATSNTGGPPREAVEVSTQALPLASERGVSGQVPASLGGTGEILGVLEGMAADMAKLAGELTAVREELTSTRKAHEEQLAIAYQRYEAVQRHSLTQIDEARRTASELRERLNTANRDAQLREDAQRGKAQVLREENSQLRAKVEMLEDRIAQK